MRRKAQKMGMKILLGNATLSLLAGSETWTLTLAKQLRKMGHHVACFSPSLGVIAEQLDSAGIRSYSDLSPSGVVPFTYLLEEKVAHEYDVIIANHFHIVGMLREKFPRTPIISTIHGIIHVDDATGEWQPEHPATESGVGQFIAVSEEVQEKLKREYSIDSLVIRNFFDLEKFMSIPPPEEAAPKRFLINTNYNDRNDPVIEAVREAAKEFDAQVMAIGENFSQAKDVTHAIRSADVVFGMGRSVLEGVAAGRLGIVHGRWGTGGVIHEGSVNALRAVNFSGRGGDSRPASGEELAAMIREHYAQKTFEWGKSYIAREHNAAFAAEQYIRIAEDLTGATINRARVQGRNPNAAPLKVNYNA